jgi:signal transduction histidine kinase
MHGGTVECRARDGGGACMVLRVPAAQPQVSKPSDNR